MFDNRWENWSSDFAESPSSSSFPATFRDHFTDILRSFGEAMLRIEPGFPDRAPVASVAKALREGMPKSAVPAPYRSEIPEVIARFAEYLGENGHLADADQLASAIRQSAVSFRETARPKAGPKGLTIRHSEKVTPLGRNDLCPCGSGKKFKKCCMVSD